MNVGSESVRCAALSPSYDGAMPRGHFGIDRRRSGAELVAIATRWHLIAMNR
jgi:hypothetical protein